MTEIYESKVKILPDFIANQIAAGEVVQRPESVVKELVENSIDAGAGSIIVSVRNAGKSLIHVIDDGNGMTKQDLELSVKRHATSKVFTSEDLEEIKTFGFRGEALASVCSVANVEIRTRKIEMPHGWKLISEPMKEEILEEINCDKGTQIFVRNLFYNVPARRKFLKSNMTEFRYISDTMIKTALSKPELRFTFYDDDTLIFDILPSDKIERIADLLGRNIKESLIPVNYQNDFVSIDGFIGEPHLSKQSRGSQYFFLNGRPILSNSLSHAVYSSYEELLDKNQKPLFVLYLNLDYSKVDVNVHPQKHEVKFDDERFVYNSVKNAVLQALRNSSYIPEVKIDLDMAANPFSLIKDNNHDILVNRMTGEMVNFDNSRASHSSSDIQHDIVKKPIIHSAFDDIFNRIDNNPSNQAMLPDNFEESSYKYINRRFIIADIGEYIYIIDQSGLHQRLIYDNITANRNGNTRVVQELLFPMEIEIDNNQFNIIHSTKGDIESLGFSFELHKDRVIFKGIPQSLKSGTEEESVRKFLIEIAAIELNTVQDIYDRICTSYSESASIKNGSELNSTEIRSLMAGLKGYRIPLYSPKGKKSVIRVTNQEFYNKLFFN
ncbi:MAG: DNA mismatch repair endonuclease MutL [Candidatus Kapaibacterium sp.]